MILGGEEYFVSIDDDFPDESPYELKDNEPDPIPVVEPLIQAPDRQEKAQAKSGVPTVKEWQDFIGRFVIRGLSQLYLSIVLRDIEEDLTPQEREMIQLTPEDLSDMAAPLASFASKNTVARKYGRQIIATADSYESFLAIAFWMRRVNKIAKKHRPHKPNTVRGHVVSERQGNGDTRSNDEQGNDVEYPDAYGWVDNPGTG